MVLTNVATPITLYDYYPASDGPVETPTDPQCTLTVTTNCIDPPQAIQQYTPNVYNITVNGLTATGATSTSEFVGVPESCILNVNLTNVNITTSTSGITTALPHSLPAGMIQLRNVTGTFTNVNLTSTHSPPIAPWAQQENVQVTTAGTTPALPYPYTGPGTGTGPLTTTPAGAYCQPYPPGNVLPIGTIP
jgi:hypothetical protein